MLQKPKRALRKLLKYDPVTGYILTKLAPGQEPNVVVRHWMSSDRTWVVRFKRKAYRYQELIAFLSKKDRQVNIWHTHD